MFCPTLECLDKKIIFSIFCGNFFVKHFFFKHEEVSFEEKKYWKLDDAILSYYILTYVFFDAKPVRKQPHCM